MAFEGALDLVISCHTRLSTSRPHLQYTVNELPVALDPCSVGRVPVVMGAAEALRGPDVEVP